MRYKPGRWSLVRPRALLLRRCITLPFVFVLSHIALAGDNLNREVNRSDPAVYIGFEGSVDLTKPEMSYVRPQMESLKRLLGPLDPRSSHLYAFSASGLTPLTRSVPFLKTEIDQAFDAAEQEGVPLMLHIDPLYGFGADGETLATDGPAVKYWNDPEMREWAEFPVEGHFPAHIPRPWFNWGCWVSPASAVPALGSPKFLAFIVKQMREGIADPIVARVTRLQNLGKGYLYAGTNIGWETGMFRYRMDLPNLPSATLPIPISGLKMQPWEATAQLGYASLYWTGWNQEKLAAEAGRRELPIQTVFDDLIFHILHDYNESVAKTLVDAGLPKEQVFTHIVPMSTVDPGNVSTNCPPVWVAVNPYSIPGFTMDSGGAAVYRLTTLKRQIREADPKQEHFAAMESYLANEREPTQFKTSIEEIFESGGLRKILFGVFEKGSKYEMHPPPDPDTAVIEDWLRAGVPRATD